jgi:hypothetical protein
VKIVAAVAVAEAEAVDVRAAKIGRGVEEKENADR